MMQHTTRRPALDGVRAVAVLAVIAYHFTSYLPGGFLGVDVFFVLSGYLITRLLLQTRRREGRIDVAEFWARRVRRLLPALLLLVAGCALATWIRDPVEVLEARRNDIIATLFYVANWHFIAAGQSYFAVFAGQSPLEHMWSLAIEEQFYVVWPLIIIVVGRVSGQWRALLTLSATGALASAVWMAVTYSESAPTRAYFGTDTRAYTLLIGAGLAILLERRPDWLNQRGVRMPTRALWPPIAVGIVAAFLTMDNEAAFYYRGGAVLFALAVAVALWIVEAEPTSLPGRLLALSPVAWVGRISYGLYLWHWPVLIWIDSSTRVESPRLKLVLAVVLTFALATASFYLVERPIRQGRAPWLRRSRPRLALAAPVAVVLVLTLGLAATRVPPSLASVADVQAKLDALVCPAGSPEPVESYRWCVRTPGVPGKTVVATAGDSTSQALFPGMEALARSRGWRYVQAGRNRCTLLSLVFPSDPSSPSAVEQARECTVAIPRLLGEVTREERPDVWIVSDRWPLLPMLTERGDVVQSGTPRHGRLVERALRARLRSLTADGATVVLVPSPPPGPPVECANTPTARKCVDGYSSSDPQTVNGRRIFQRAARGQDRVVTVSVEDVVCPGGRCPAAIHGQVVRYDGVHLTTPFSRAVAKVIVGRAAAAGARFD